jgi:heat shock protein HslJ
MRTQKFLAVLGLFFILILAACQSATPTLPPAPTTNPLANQSMNPLDKTNWTLVSLSGQPVMQGTQITMNFLDGGKVSGTDGCNNYSTYYTVVNDRINFNKNIVSSMMACPDPIMKQAAAYTTSLLPAYSYKIDGIQLTLLDEGGKTLSTFTKTTSALSDTSWYVTSFINDKKAMVSALSGTELTANFSANGNLSGSSGCNDYNSTYQVAGKGIKFGPIASTKKMCSDPAGVMEQENQYMTALAIVSIFNINDNELALRTSDGETVVTYARKGTVDTTSTQAPQNSVSFLQALLNAAYPVEGTSTGTAQLKDGVFEELAAPGSATNFKVQLGKDQALGDLNGDGNADAVVTLVVDPGGSGTFTYLAPVINDQGMPKPLTTVLLGDRIIVKSVAIKDGEVVVTLLTRKPDEPMSAEPTVETTRTFKFAGDQLVEMK